MKFYSLLLPVKLKFQPENTIKLNGQNIIIVIRVCLSVL